MPGVPVISLESATLHPLQSFADVLTIKELFTENRRPRVALTWAPHIKALPHCVANSFAQWINAWGEADLVIAQPEGYELDPRYTGAATITTTSPKRSKGPILCMLKTGAPRRPTARYNASDANWMLTLNKLKPTNQAKVMHCLPVRRNLELSAEVLDSAQQHRGAASRQPGLGGAGCVERQSWDCPITNPDHLTKS